MEVRPGERFWKRLREFGPSHGGEPMEWAGEGVQRRPRWGGPGDEEEESKDAEAATDSKEEKDKKKEEEEIPIHASESPVFLPAAAAGGESAAEGVEEVQEPGSVKKKKSKQLKPFVDWEDPGENVLEAATREAEEGHRRWIATTEEDEWRHTEMMAVVEQVRRFKKRVKEAEPPPAIYEHVEEMQLGTRTLRKLPKGILRPGAWSGSDPMRDGSLDAKDDGKDSRLGRMAVAIHKGFLRQRAQAHPAAAHLGTLPAAERPEVAFIGASNVGKSSLLNALTRTSGLVPARHDKGLTRRLSWYKCSRLPMDVLDLPGYGVAKGADFGPLLAEFVRERKALRALYVLVDAQTGLLRKDWNWLAKLGKDGPPKIFVLTKCDLVPPKGLPQVATVVLEDMVNIPKAMQRLIMVSAKKGQGMHDLRCDLCARAIAFQRQIRARKEARLAAKELSAEPAKSG